MLGFYLKYLEPFTKFMETLLEFMRWLAGCGVFCQAALLITKSLFWDREKPSCLLGLMKKLENLKNSNK